MTDEPTEKPLEEKINENEHYMQVGTKQALGCARPFQYMSALSRLGEKDYGVPYYKSFYFGVDASLDYYSPKKEFTGAKYESLLHGSRCIIRYVANNMTELPDEDE